MTTLSIRVTGLGSDEELRSLYEWLLREPGIRQHTQMRLVPKESRPGDMGDVLDLISLLVATGLQLPSLATSLTVWRSTRRRKLPLTIAKGDVTITIPDGDSETALKMLEALMDED
ncbi:effector-associated constant component EACC1 [Microbispora triticiradicis]|uniref:effector-associated constant component EACC1 n=1 Tax=Microbispora triticiradicis TaxID=2200763 RepID=UPI0010583ED6|nr:hypothetical protein [Microbispora triticiradicis]GLW21748.1 hypothetical protein Mame01_17910 [Microbispora amethystogenes]